MDSFTIPGSSPNLSVGYAQAGVSQGPGHDRIEVVLGTTFNMRSGSQVVCLDRVDMSDQPSIGFASTQTPLMRLSGVLGCSVISSGLDVMTGVIIIPEASLTV